MRLYFFLILYKKVNDWILITLTSPSAMLWKEQQYGHYPPQLEFNMIQDKKWYDFVIWCRIRYHQLTFNNLVGYCYVNMSICISCVELFIYVQLEFFCAPISYSTLINHQPYTMIKSIKSLQINIQSWIYQCLFQKPQAK